MRWRPSPLGLVRAIRRVMDSLTHLKAKRKRPKEFKPKSIDYDARIFSYRELDETFSLLLLLVSVLSWLIQLIQVKRATYV